MDDHLRAHQALPVVPMVVQEVAAEAASLDLRRCLQGWRSIAAQCGQCLIPQLMAVARQRLHSGVQ